MKKISLLLTLTLLISAFSFTNVMAANEYYVNDDFSAASIDTNWDNATSANGLTLKTNNSNQYLEWDPEVKNSISITRKDLTERISTGIIKFEFDYMPNQSSRQFIGLSQAGMAKSHIEFQNGKISYDGENTARQRTELGTYTAGTWYHIEMEFDLDFSKMHFRITDSNGNTYKKTNVDYICDSDSAAKGQVNNITTPRFNIQKTGEPVGIDNVKMYSIDDTTLDKVAITKSFEGFSDDFSAAEIDSNWANATSANGCSLVTENGEQYLKIDRSSSLIITRSDCTTPITTGVVKLEFDYYFTDKGVHFGLSKPGSGRRNLYITASGKVYSGTDTNTTTSCVEHGNVGFKKWYHIEMVYDLDFGKMHFVIKDKAANNKVLFDVADVTYDSTSNNITTPRFQVTKGRLDNVSFGYKAETPVVTATLSNGRDTYTDITKVPVDANMLTIDFGTTMHPDSLPVRRVALKKADGTFVATTGKLADFNRKYVLTFEPLTPGAEYTLFVSGKVANINCEEMGENSETVIKIDPGKLTVAVSDVKSGENSVANTLANFTGAVTPELTVTNTTGKEYTVNMIYAYYTANGLKTVPVDNDVTIAADGTVTGLDPHTVCDLTGVEKVKIMVWSDMTNIEPLCTVYEIK